MTTRCSLPQPSLLLCNLSELPAIAAALSSSGGQRGGSRGGAATGVAHPHRRGVVAGAARPLAGERRPEQLLHGGEKETVDGASDRSDALSLALTIYI
jgi:hypothetical protein